MMLIASKNPHKVAMLRQMLAGLEDAVSLDEAGVLEKGFAESGDSLLRIAESKASFYSERFGGRVIATDAGAEIPALKGWDPRFTKRFAGERLTDFERMDKLLEMARNLKGNERRFWWTECAAIAEKGKVVFSFEAKGDEGLLQTSYNPKKYRKGIWLCSLWHYPRFGKNFFDLTKDEVKATATSWSQLSLEVRRFLEGSE